MDSSEASSPHAAHPETPQPDSTLSFDCGIESARITRWLDDELQLPRQGASWVYRAGESSCQVNATPAEPRVFRNLSLPRTHLGAHGGSEAVESFEKLFTLRFMSAGG